MKENSPIAESKQHMNYVNLVEQYVLQMIPSKQKGFIYVDKPEAVYKPPLVGNFRPDLYFCAENKLIIGEAKTVTDFERFHSKEQYKTYLQACQEFKGDSLLILCSSWSVAFSFKTLIKSMKKQNCFDTKVIIISEEGIPEIIV